MHVAVTLHHSLRILYKLKFIIAVGIGMYVCIYVRCAISMIGKDETRRAVEDIN